MVGVAYNPPSTRPQGRPDEPRDRYQAVRPVPPAGVPGDDAIEEFADVVGWLTGDWREALRIRFLRASGLRWGEHADLRVGRVSLDPGLPSVHVCSQAVEIPRRYGDGGPTLRLGQPPKGGRARHAFYDHDMVAGDLERLGAGIRRDRSLTGRPDTALLFPAPRGGAVRAGTHSSRVWGPAAAACGWQRVEDQPTAPGAKSKGWVWTPHSLRHRYATFLDREAKADLLDVSEWMGHSDTEDHPQDVRRPHRTERGRGRHGGAAPARRPTAGLTGASRSRRPGRPGRRPYRQVEGAVPRHLRGVVVQRGPHTEFPPGHRGRLRRASDDGPVALSGSVPTGRHRSLMTAGPDGSAGVDPKSVLAQPGSTVVIGRFGMS